MGLLSSFAQSAGGLLAPPPPVQPPLDYEALLQGLLAQQQGGHTAPPQAPQLPDVPIEQPQLAQSQMPPVQQGAPRHGLIGGIESAVGGLLGLPANQGQPPPQQAPSGLPTPPQPYTPLGGIPGMFDRMFLGGAGNSIRRGDYNAKVAGYQQQVTQAYLGDIANKYGPDAARMALADPKRFEDLYGYHNNAEGSTYTGQDGQVHIAPKAAVTPGGVPTVFNDAGFHTAPQLPGEKAIDAGSGQVIDKNIGLTGQSVPVPQKFAPGETPGQFNSLNFGASGPAPTGGAFGPSPFGQPPQLPTASDLPPPPPPPTAARPVGGLTVPQASAIAQNPAAVFSHILGAKVTVNSAVRSPGHNAAVGGSPTSEHMAGNGQAYDIQLPPGMKHAQAIAMIRKAGLPVDQFGVDGGALHVGFKPPGIAGRNSIIGSPSYNVAANAPRKGQPGFSGVTMGQPAGGGFKIVPGSQVPNGDPNLNYKISPSGDISPIAKSFTMENVQTNRKAFYEGEQYKAASEALAPLQGLFHTVDSVAPGGVVGIAALDTLNKSLNPGGVVRPQTVQLFLDHLGLPEEFKSHVSGIVGNGPLSPNVVKQIGRAAWQYGKAHIDQAQTRADADTALAVRNGYQPEDAGETVPQMPTVPLWAQDPRPMKPVDGRVYWTPQGPMKYTPKGYIPQ